ncbi:putative DsbA family dithiol-disulfide isomerase [Lysobacter niastensis]|uniref:DsbA family dithiol-disulfide isomerase n=1 Tax=Lysobacter niastensis TaxID=380629 RepID=A0ABU1WEL3_9GAMM|nr:DsbA family oxidoreductase [Lysobacter niastensis]MDR7135812.1 putative DsbA family dithiol-disulfide isomerase [Lysobacter niastensis]
MSAESDKSKVTIGIHFDLICPWCFIGKRHFEAARARLVQKYPAVVVESVWQPVQLLPEVPEQGLPFAQFYERRLGSPQAVRQRRQQIEMAARKAGLELDMAAIQRMPNTARAIDLLRRVATLGQPALYEALLERLFVAYFQRGEDIGDAATLRSLAEEVGVASDQLGDVKLDYACNAPAESAVPGVPHFVFNGRLSLSGAHDAAILFDAMSHGVQESIAADCACA